MLSASFVAAAPTEAPALQTTGAGVLTVRAPSYLVGNATFTGLAVDCATGQAATRVAVYDGEEYFADASIDTMMNISRACPGRSGNARIGYTLIINTRTLSEGGHTLSFVAQFPNGTTTSTSLMISAENSPPMENYCSDMNC